jgi:hypothetical protein
MTWLHPKYLDADGEVFQPQRSPIGVLLANGEAGTCSSVCEESVKGNRQVTWAAIPRGAALVKDGHVLWRAPADRDALEPEWAKEPRPLMLRAGWGHCGRLNFYWNLRNRVWSWRPDGYRVHGVRLVVADWGPLCVRGCPQYVAVELHWPVALSMKVWLPGWLLARRFGSWSI